MEKNKKLEVKALLAEFVETKCKSQNEAAKLLKGVSSATVSNILNGKFESISDEMFDNVYRQLVVGGNGWNYTDTNVSKELSGIFREAQENSMSFWVIGNSGCGKSSTTAMYKNEHREVFSVVCSELMSTLEFLNEMARSVGATFSGCSKKEVLDNIADRLCCMENPLIILDEADKLKDASLYSLITIDNRIGNRAGMVMLSTEYGKKRLEKGTRLEKRGYREIWSRIGGRCYNLEKNGAMDVQAICIANGINDPRTVKAISNDVAMCQYDLRRCERVIHKMKIKLGLR